MLLLFFVAVSFADDVPAATGHVIDLPQQLPESMVRNLEASAAQYSKNQHLNLVILVMGVANENACSVSKTETCAKKILDVWGKVGQADNDRGTLLLLVYMSGHPPEIEATGALHRLVTLDLRMNVWSAASEPMKNADLPQVIVRSVNALTDAFMDGSSRTDQVQARR